MQELLFLVHRIPFPPNKGDKIRSYRLLDFLRRHYRVHLGTFIDDEYDWAFTGRLEKLCASSCFVPLNPRTARLRCLTGLFTGEPLSLPYYRDRRLRTWVKERLRTRPIKAIVIFSSAMAQYVDVVRNVRRHIDFVDVDSDKWSQYALRKAWPASLLYRREASRLLAVEKKIASTFEVSTFVSEAEANLFRRLAPEVAGKVAHFNNGVDTEYFDPSHRLTSPYAENVRSVVFTGAMDYWANVDAVIWFATNVYPILRARGENIVFYIVGARPVAEVLTLAHIPGVTVTGTVEDIRPYLAFARLAVAPLRIARGIQNKVLEAMAMQKAVVASPQAVEGLDISPGKDIVVAESAEEFAQSILALLESDQADAIACAARQRVVDDYGWDAALQRFHRCLLHGDDGERDDFCRNRTSGDEAAR